MLSKLHTSIISIGPVGWAIEGISIIASQLINDKLSFNLENSMRNQISATFVLSNKNNYDKMACVNGNTYVISSNP
jgi:hypothetical protein